ncbi:hypothetical protein [Pseudomonas sp. Irchel s3h17]|uniref:hypothetical protein n=1 Tax=Pseudomonas sp. Irchel s3h17 TaxID=2009182 RepID=UPI001C496EBB|nr:hypothetical protein [Pseudomonas sp. Irchel s3h17]
MDPTTNVVLLLITPVPTEAPSQRSLSVIPCREKEALFHCFPYIFHSLESHKITKSPINLWTLVRSLLLCVATFSLSACGSNVEVPVPSTRYLITSGVGLPDCRIGKDENNFIEQFGGKKWEDYWTAESKGVGVKVVDGKIATMFFFFYSKTHTSFDGQTNVGIGKNSSINDVVRAYGEPQRIGESDLPDSSAMPGAHEISLEYPSMGIVFTFWDRRLADIRVFAARPY